MLERGYAIVRRGDESSGRPTEVAAGDAIVVASPTAASERQLAEPTFEEAQGELEWIVERLERGDAGVDELTELWERGEELYRICAAKLESVRGKIEELAQRRPEPAASSSPRRTRSSPACARRPESACARTPSRTTPPKSSHANAEPLAAAHDGARRLALERRRVDRALAGDDEGGAARALVEADRVEHELRALDELAAESGERRAEPAAGSRAGQVAVRRELAHRREPRLELLDGLRARALLRAEDPRRAALAEQWVAHVAEDAHRDVAQPGADDRAQPGAAVDGRRARRRRRAAPSGRVASAARSSSPSPRLVVRSGSRSLGASSGSPIACGRLDDRRAVGQHELARRDRDARAGR